MSEFNFAPITAEDIDDLRKLAENWYRTRWGSEMPPSTSRGMAKDVIRLLDHLKTVEAERDKLRGDYQSWSELCDDKDKEIAVLKEQLEGAFATGTNTKDEFENNPCSICGSPPGVHCPHD